MATVFDLSDSPGVWFEMDGGGRVKLRTIPAESFKEIRKKTVKKKEVFKKVEGTPWRFEYEDVNEDLQNELFWDYVIVDWEDFVDKEQKPIPCTKENKTKMMTRSVMFARFVADSLKTLSDSEAKEAEAAEKN